MAKRKWYESGERKEARGKAKEKGVYAWRFQRAVRVLERGKRREEVRCGYYVGLHLPLTLRSAKVLTSLVYAPEGLEAARGR